MARDAIESTCESVPKGQHNSKGAVGGGYHSRDVLISFAWYIITKTRQLMRRKKMKGFCPSRGICMRVLTTMPGSREEKRVTAENLG